MIFVLSFLTDCLFVIDMYKSDYAYDQFHFHPFLGLKFRVILRSCLGGSAKVALVHSVGEMCKTNWVKGRKGGVADSAGHQEDRCKSSERKRSETMWVGDQKQHLSRNTIFSTYIYM